MHLKDLPPQERPRERLARHGKEALSLIELLAILLGSGTKEHSVLHLSQNLLSHFGSLKHLSCASVRELCDVKGIGMAKALQLQAVFALVHRVKQEETELQISDKKTLFAFLQQELGTKEVEVLMVLLCDVKKRLIHQEIVAQGTLTELILHPREVFHTDIRHRAHSVIIAHNHPSGDPTPSPRDLEITQILAHAGRIVGIELLDHIIVGRTSCVSLCQ